MIKWFIDLIWFIWNEQDYLCPHCGYYCTNKTIYCIPPKERAEND